MPLAATVITRDRFRALLWNIPPSYSKEDVKNDERKGTPHYDKVLINPFIDDICSACQASYHPHKELAVDRRMVATKAKTGVGIHR